MNRFIPGIGLSTYLSADLVDSETGNDSVIEISGGDDEDDASSIYLSRSAMKRLIRFADRCWGEGWQERVR
jgi:hypothetical protein